MTENDLTKSLEAEVLRQGMIAIRKLLWEGRSDAACEVADALHNFTQVHDSALSRDGTIAALDQLASSHPDVPRSMTLAFQWREIQRFVSSK
ncbi:hypothetical protein [Paracoccus sp. TOH]|uniref:hypothetical protein n=1 Tax=Paracoccus sp. TOH TaxID=1263728 RepID=UPI0025B26D24|nr:hypothetical protein [Paracoccus sp. TOH]WJS87207.1 hypothetical protein NBE95_20220 [Paracoccus sp. TOH]